MNHPTIGGIRVGLDIFELSVVPSLLNNAETWVGMNTDTEDRLDNLQNCMFRTIFAVPKSTPKPILRWDLGHLSMKEKIHAKKLNFLLHLKNLPNNSLAAEFYDIQVKLNFPGLVEECRNLLKNYNLPNIIDGNNTYSKLAWKKLVKKAIHKKSENLLRSEIQEYSKLRDITSESENLDLKEYVKNMTMRQARTKFKLRSHMLDVKMNRKSDKRYSDTLWRCDFCLSLDSQSHIMWCPAFSSLREGRNIEDDKDIVSYIDQVMKLRNR